MAVEIVSPESEAQDHKTKPLKYTEAGIPHLWRVENEADQPVIRADEWDETTAAYVATPTRRGTAVVHAPFPWRSASVRFFGADRAPGNGRSPSESQM